MIATLQIRKNSVFLAFIKITAVITIFQQNEFKH